MTSPEADSAPVISGPNLQVPNVDLLSWVFGNEEYHEDKPIFVDAQDPSSFISRRAAKVTVKKLIAGLLAAGVQPGDSICVHAINNVYYTLVYLAIIGAQGCFVGSNPAYTSYEIKHLLRTSGTQFVICSPELFKNLLPAAHECGVVEEKIYVFNVNGGAPSPEGFKTWWSLQEHGETDWNSFDDEIESKSTMAALMTTSGTTGLPKAAALSHYSLVAQNIMCYDSKEKPYKVLRLLCLPQFHAFAGPLYHIAPLREGHTTYIMKRFNKPDFVENIKVLGITETAVANPIIMSILNSAESVADNLASLRYVWTAGSPLTASLQNQFGDLLHEDAILSQVWGLTEIGWVTTFLYPEKDFTGSVGRLLPGVEAKIVPDDDDAKTGEEEEVIGEINIRGPALMSGYLKNPAATQNTVVDGWLHTGDIGFQKEGKFYVIDRAKELIKVSGWQVSPAELETCLLTHPQITDAAVIGVDLDDDRGERPRAYIVLDTNVSTPVTDEEIYTWMEDRMTKYKTLTGGIKRVLEIERNASGKILKNILREGAKAERLEELQVARFKKELEETQLSNASDVSESMENAEGTILPSIQTTTTNPTQSVDENVRPSDSNVALADQVRKDLEDIRKLLAMCDLSARAIERGEYLINGVEDDEVQDGEAEYGEVQDDEVQEGEVGDTQVDLYNA